MEENKFKGTWDKTKEKSNQESGHTSKNAPQEIKGEAEKGAGEIKDTAKTTFDRGYDKNQPHKKSA